MDEWSWLVFTQSCQPHHHTSCIKQLGSETVDHRVKFAGKREREPLYFFSYGGPRGESCVSRLWSSVSRGCSAKDFLQHI